MNDRTKRDIDHGQTVAKLDVCVWSRDHCVTYCEAIGSQDIGFFTINIAEQGQIGRTVRIVFDGNNLGRNAILIPFPINYPIFPFVSATIMPCSDPAMIVAAACFLQRSKQALFRTLAGKIILLQ